MIDVESYILFLTAAFFTIIYLNARRTEETYSTAMGAVSSAVWIVLGFMWLFLAHESPSYQTYAVGLLFNGIGILFIVLVILDLIEMKHIRRYLE